MRSRVIANRVGAFFVHDLVFEVASHYDLEFFDPPGWGTRAPVAQLDRASVYGTEGYRFKSCRVYFRSAASPRKRACARVCDRSFYYHGIRRTRFDWVRFGLLRRVERVFDSCPASDSAAIERTGVGFAPATDVRGRLTSIIKTSGSSRSSAPIKARCFHASEAAIAPRSSGLRAPRSNERGRWRCFLTSANDFDTLPMSIETDLRAPLPIRRRAAPVPLWITRAARLLLSIQSRVYWLRGLGAKRFKSLTNCASSSSYGTPRRPVSDRLACPVKRPLYASST